MSKQIKIVHVSDDNCDVSLNVGSINGVQEGDKFLVYSVSCIIKIPIIADGSPQSCRGNFPIIAEPCLVFS